MNNNRSYAEVLMEIYNFLTPETWIKHHYIQYEGNRFCFCIHGAAQNICNSEVKQALDLFDKFQKLIRYHGNSGVGAMLNKSDYFEAWKYRPAKRGLDYNIQHLLGMFGITPKFNDHPTTTLEILKSKLLELINWVEANEEFLQNN